MFDATFTRTGETRVDAAIAEFPLLVHTWSRGRVSVDLRVAHVAGPVTRTVTVGGYVMPDLAEVRDLASTAGVYDEQTDGLMVRWPHPAPVYESHEHAAGHSLLISAEILPGQPFGAILRYTDELGGRPYAEIGVDPSGDRLGGHYPGEGIVHEWLHTFIATAARSGGDRVDLDVPSSVATTNRENSWGHWYDIVLQSVCDSLESRRENR